ncbi:MAG: S-layer homology domain-containing protein [Acutalibacter sp.]|nr:S-layer homology domain-containing protein [Acutalibacter sp.]
MERKNRRRRSRPICLILAVMLLISALPLTGLTASAANMKGAFFVSGNPPFAYVVTGLRAEDGDDTVKLYQNADMQSYDGYSGEYTIPERVYDVSDMKYYTVTEIGGAVGDTVPGAFEGVGLRGVVLPKTVATIGARAFADCTSLREITFPTSVTSLAVNAFDRVYLQQLTLNVSNGATLFSNSAYMPQNDSSLITLPHELTELIISAPLTVVGPVSVSGSTRVSNTGVTVQGGASLTLWGTLSGTGVIEVRNSGTLTLQASPVGYSGSIRLSGADSALVNHSSAAVTVQNAAGQTMTVQPGETFTGKQSSNDPAYDPDGNGGTLIRPKIIANYGGSITVEDGGKVVVISAYAGFHVENVIINGLSMGPITRYEFEVASEANTVEVVFAQGGALEGPEPPITDPSFFVDVPADASYAAAVKFLFNNGILQGVSRTQFAPNQITSRAMFVSVMKRLEIYGASFHLKCKTPVYSEDVDKNAWYAESAGWAMGTGVLPMVNGVFWPNRPITREEAALCLSRFNHLRGYATPIDAGMYHGYWDSTLLGPESRNAMLWAVRCGYLTAKNGTLNPAGQITRAEMAQMFARYLQTR